MGKTALVYFSLIFCYVAVSPAQERNRGGRPPATQGGPAERTRDDVRGQPAHPVVPPRITPVETSPPTQLCPPISIVQIVSIECFQPVQDRVLPLPGTDESEQVSVVQLYDSQRFPLDAGYDFSDEAIRPFNDPDVDMYFELTEGICYLKVQRDTDILDVGPLRSLSELETIPMNQWPSIHAVSAVVGHVYVLWTWDNQFVKFRLTELSRDRLSLEWQYLKKNPRPYNKALIRDGVARRGLLASRFGR